MCVSLSVCPFVCVSLFEPCFCQSLSPSLPLCRWHQAGDDLPIINWYYVEGFVNIGIAYIVELGLSTL